MANDIQVWQGEGGKFLLNGKQVSLPAGWCFVAAGDPGLTRRIKATGEYWVLVHNRRNRIEGQGLYALRSRVEKIRRDLDAEREDPAYQRKLDAGRRSREAKQVRYEGEFLLAVKNFLAFAPKYADLSERLSEAVTVHAVPVGSGTVARTERIPLERRAEAAVIAWMRHQTTAYDNMTIARVKGERREVRRKLAERSRKLLAKYRKGESVDLTECPLAQALSNVPQPKKPQPAPAEKKQETTCIFSESDVNSTIWGEFVSFDD